MPKTSVTDPARPAPRRRRGPVFINTANAIRWALLLPFTIAGMFIPAASGGVRAICAVLTVALIAMLAYYLLPWEVWLKRYMDRNDQDRSA